MVNLIVIPTERMLIPLENKALTADAILKNATVNQPEDFTTRRRLTTILEKVILARSVVLKNGMTVRREGLIKKRNRFLTGENTANKRLYAPFCLFIAYFIALF